MVGRALLQMDQAAPANQIFFRNIRECREEPEPEPEPDLDRNLGLRAHRHHQKGAKAGNRTLHYFTDSEPRSFRENTTESTVYEK
jgi:hypothetical protein